MALITKTGTLQSISADETGGALTLKIPHDPPPPEFDELTWLIPTGPMLTVAAGAKIGDSITIEYDSATPGTAKKVRRP